MTDSADLLIVTNELEGNVAMCIYPNWITCSFANFAGSEPIWEQWTSPLTTCCDWTFHPAKQEHTGDLNKTNNGFADLVEF